MPLFSPSSSSALSETYHSIRPRRPSLEPEGEILSTRGQRLASLIRRRSFSAQSPDPYDDGARYDELTMSRNHMDVPPLERASRLIGDIKSVYNWYATDMEDILLPKQDMK
jgi:hypothetical protein